MKTVLIIDDELSVCHYIELLMARREMVSIHAYSLASAKKVVEEECPMIIFIDNHLPDGLGIEFIPALRVKCPNAVIICMTFDNSQENKTRAIANGADFFIEKPFPCNFIKKLDKLLTKPTDLDSLRYPVIFHFNSKKPSELIGRSTSMFEE